MLQILNLTESSDKEIGELLRGRKRRVNKEMEETIRGIITDVIESGDEALRYYTAKFDKVEIEEMLVSEEEINKAYDSVEDSFKRAIEDSKKNIEDYHNNQKYTGYIYTKELGIFMGQRVKPLDKVGIYVPGGTAAYPSTVLMNAIPAKVAGVKDIIMITPPDSKGRVNPYTLVAARISGVNKIYKVGGAQGIAALTYGTQSIEAVDKIVGPGNMYVAEAKRLVFGDVGIDMIAGPSEIVVIADSTSDPKYIAADLLSQAEHDVFASAILLTNSYMLANKVILEVEKQIKDLQRVEIIKQALINYGKIIICESLNDAVKVANKLAPEHLEVLTEKPLEILGEINNAASIFLGKYTPEPLGDYFAGTNHVLPTNGTARFSSPLSVETFLKKSSFLYYSKEALVRDGNKIIEIARAEGLMAHSNSIRVRLNDEEDQ